MFKGLLVLPTDEPKDHDSSGSSNEAVRSDSSPGKTEGISQVNDMFSDLLISLSPTKCPNSPDKKASISLLPQSKSEVPVVTV